MKIVHLSHTDISSDSRILKEMNVFKDVKKFKKIIGVGMALKIASKNTDMLNNLKIHRVSSSIFRFNFIPYKLRRLVVFINFIFQSLFIAIKEKPAVVHCNDTYVLPIGILIKFFCKSKVIYDAHELESNRNGIGKFFGSLILFTEKVCWRFVDALIVVSPSIVTWYDENVGKKKTEIILNAPVFNQNKDESNTYLRDKFNISKDSKIFLYVGGLVKGRGIKLLLNSFKSDEISSHLVFLGYGNLSEEIKQISKEYPNIHIHEAVAHEKVVSVSKSADVGLCLIENVSLSDYYCLPNKLFEYAFANIPVLASNFPDMAKVIKEHELGICTDLDKKSVVEAIKKFEKSDEIFKMKDLHELSWEAQEEKLIKLYDEVLEIKKV